MILNLDDNILIDMDRVSAVVPGDKFIVIDGTVLTVQDKNYIEIISDAFKWIHKTHIYTKDLKKEGGK